MSMARDKKRIERRSLNLLLFADGFAAPLQVEERERPDFLVCYEDRSVGVEITEVMKNPQMRGSRAWEGNAGAVLVAAESEWESRGLSPVGPARVFGVGFPNKNRQVHQRRNDCRGASTTERRAQYRARIVEKQGRSSG